MAKAKAKNKKPAAKAKVKPAAKKPIKKVAKKQTPKAKKAVIKPVKKEVVKPAKKVKPVKAKPVAIKKITANNNSKVVNKPVASSNSKPVSATNKVAPSVKLLKKVAEKQAQEKKAIQEPRKLYTIPGSQPTNKAPKKAKMNLDLNLRYSDEELKEFKDLIDKKLVAAREELHNLKEALDNHTESQAGNKAWNMEEGTDTSELEYLMNQISRQHQYIRNLELALIRVENKTYGICRVTGKLIPKERLRVVPHATLSLEAKMTRKTDLEETPATANSAPPTDFAESFED